MYRYHHAEEYLHEYMTALDSVQNPNPLQRRLRRRPPSVWAWKLPFLAVGIFSAVLIVGILAEGVTIGW